MLEQGSKSLEGKEWSGQCYCYCWLIADVSSLACQRRRWSILTCGCWASGRIPGCSSWSTARETAVAALKSRLKFRICDLDGRRLTAPVFRRLVASTHGRLCLSDGSNQGSKTDANKIIPEIGIGTVALTKLRLQNCNVTKIVRSQTIGVEDQGCKLGHSFPMRFESIAKYIKMVKPCRDTGSSGNNAPKCRPSTISKATAQHPRLSRCRRPFSGRRVAVWASGSAWQSGELGATAGESDSDVAALIDVAAAFDVRCARCTCRAPPANSLTCCDLRRHLPGWARAPFC